MALLGLLAAGGRLLAKKLAHHRARSGAPTAGITPTESQDLGIEGAPTYTDGVADQPTLQGNLPALTGPSLGAIQTSPTFISRAKCPRGYSFIKTRASSSMFGRPVGVCVLTKVARALGLAARRRGKGISSRDLRAAMRVQRLVHRLGPKFGRHVSRGHGPGCACKRCK